MSKTVLVTGGTGFVGSHVVESYLAAGWNVRAIVRNPRRLKWLAPLKIDLVTGSLDDPLSLRSAVEGCSTVVHCAGLTKAVYAKDYYRTNADATSSLVEAARLAGVKRFVYCSSQAAAGPARNGAASLESDTPSPITDYGKSKLEGELRVRTEAGAMEWIILRPPSVIGPRDEQFLSLFQGIVSYGRYPVFGGTAFGYSFVCVHDLAKALLLAGETAAGWNDVYYVCSPQVLTWREAADVVGDILHRRVRPLNLPKSILTLMGAGASVYSRIFRKPVLLSRDKIDEILTPGWICSAEKMYRTWGFECQCSIGQTLTETYEFYVREKWL